MKNKSKTSNLLSNIPLIFEKNIGQQDSEVKYILKQNGCTTFFTQGEVVSVFNKKVDGNNENDINNRDSLKFNIDKYEEISAYETNVLRMKLENLNKNSKILGQDELNCKVNYFRGSKEDWVTDVDLYEKIIYKDIYENIDLVYYSNEGNLEYDFILKPQANVEDIKISFEGADNIYINKDKNLKIDIKDSSIYLLKPKSYQLIDSDNVEVKSEFIIDENKVSLKIDKYDKSKTLIIDPILLYSTYIGGISEDRAHGIAVDNNENAYITGYTYSINFPTTPNAYQTTFQAGHIDAFLVKIDTKSSDSSSLVYSSYIGGSSSDYGCGVAVDSNGIAYITGWTYSTDFPTTSNAYQTIYQGGGDAFLTKIDTELSGINSLVYSSYIGGSNLEQSRSIDIDLDENAYITGITSSTNFPTTSNAYQGIYKGYGDVFLTRIDTKLSGNSSLIYSTYIGGYNDDEGTSLVVDENKNVYITGKTYSLNFPITPNAYQGINKGSLDVFLTRIDTKLSGNSSLIYSTYIGGSDSDSGYGIAIDGNENVYIAGSTSSLNFPTTPNAYRTTSQGGSNTFLSRIDTRLSGSSSLIYSTYIGSNYGGQGGIVVDDNENAYITGMTYSSDFPITPNAYQGMYQGGGDTFLTRVDTKLSGESGLIYSTYIGGSSHDVAVGISIDRNKNAYITGYTASSNFPTTLNAYQTTLKGGEDVFLVKMRTQGPFVKLQMNKVANLQFADIGTTIAYTITLNNSGNISANNIIFIDTIPNGTVFIANSLNINGITVPQSPDGVSIGSINAEDTMTISFKAKVDTIPTTNTIENSAVANYTYTKYLSIPNGETGSSNSNIVTTKVNHVDMIVNKTTTPVYISCDGTITYTVTLQNIGSTTAENIIFRDTIPNQTRFIPNSLKVNGTTIPGQNPAVGVNIGSIGPNSIKTVTFGVTAIC